MDKNSLVILRGSKEETFDGEVFRPLSFYRSIEAAQRVYIVNGVAFLKSEWDETFELVYDKVMRDWHEIGLVVDGKPISKKAFKELADVHTYGKQTNNNRIILFTTHPKECMYGFYPAFNENKAKQLDAMYMWYLKVIDGEMDYFDQEEIQFGNCGIPISHSDLRKRY